MNWMIFFACSLLVIGGFIAISYEIIAGKMSLTIRSGFRRNGLITIAGEILAFGALLLCLFINPWWTTPIILIAGFIISKIATSAFRAASQVLSIVLLLAGVIIMAL